MPLDVVKTLYLWLSDALGTTGLSSHEETTSSGQDNMTGFPSTMTTPSASDSSAMAADAGYFPPMPRSHRSSISSGSDMVTPDMLEKTPAPAPQHRTATALAAVAATSHPTKTLDPLARQYPVPAGELNLDELLAREPRKWTLGHYLTTPTREVPPPVQDKERRAKELEAAKKELLEGWGSMQNLGARHR